MKYGCFYFCTDEEQKDEIKESSALPQHIDVPTSPAEMPHTQSSHGISHAGRSIPKFKVKIENEPSQTLGSQSHIIHWKGSKSTPKMAAPVQFLTPYANNVHRPSYVKSIQQKKTTNHFIFILFYICVCCVASGLILDVTCKDLQCIYLCVV